MLRAMIVCLLFTCFELKSQVVFVNNGAVVQFNSGLNVSVNGSFRNDSSGIFNQQGLFQLSGDLENKAVLNLSGEIRIHGNWINDSLFTATPTSLTLFNGGNQLVSGTVSSRFGMMELSGTGSKKLEINTQTATLRLNDRELNTDSFAMAVETADVNALTRSSGYVFSARNGRLIRKMQPGATWLFPTGTAQHYRPLMLEISAGTVSTGVRYAETDASVEGLQRTFTDSSICRTNPEFYYLLSDSVAAGTQVTHYMDSELLSTWSGIASRSISQPAIWRHHLPFELLQQNGSTFFRILIAESGSRALILDRRRPGIPSLAGDQEVCRNSSGIVYTADLESGNSVFWNVSGGSLSSINANPTLISWGQDSTGLVTAIQTDGAGCSSLAATLPVILNPAPTAAITIVSPDLPFENESFEFISTGSGAFFFGWLIGDFSAYDSVVIKAFDAPGIYPVTLIVTNTFGCRDTAFASVEVIEGIMFPNTFSPDGDGINDELNFQNSGISLFSLEIYNRWGNQVFYSEASKVTWDGRTSSGERVNPGTYFYVLKASSAQKQYDKRGSVTVFY